MTTSVRSALGYHVLSIGAETLPRNRPNQAILQKASYDIAVDGWHPRGRWFNRRATRMRDFNSSTIARFAVSVAIAAGIATWSAPSEARVFNRASHSASHRLHFHSFPYSYHRRNLFGHRSYFPYGSYCSVFGHHPFLPNSIIPLGRIYSSPSKAASKMHRDRHALRAWAHSHGHSPRFLID